MEQLIKDLIAALNANTAAVSGGVATTSDKAETTTTAAKGKGKKADTTEAAKPEHSQEEVTAALVKIKDDFGIEHARAVMKKHKYDKMGDIKPEHFDAIFNEAEKLHAELTEEADAGEGDGL